jgi:hypothetical protein
MPYTIAQFKAAGLYMEALPTVEGEIESGGAVWQDLPTGLRKRLAAVGGGKYNDPSREDASVITALLRHDLIPQDVYATFDASARGANARTRKAAHYDEYVQRTIRAQIGFLGKELMPKKSDDLFVGENWKANFRTVAQLNQEPLEFVIEQMIPEEGVTGIGGLSGHGKTWVMMSMAKAIQSGSKWLGYFETKKYPVLYLTPECGDRSFNRRAKLLEIPSHSSFLIRTMSQGKILPLLSDEMREASKGRVVFLDTFIRFAAGKNEQASDAMSALNEEIRELLQAGAVAIIFAHHSPKNARNELVMDLENVFRGSGDIGANLDAAHAVRVIDDKKVTLQFQCVKPRDFEPCEPFQITARPHIDDSHDLLMTKDPGLCGDLAKEKKTKGQNETAHKIKKYLQANADKPETQRVKMSGARLYDLVGGNKKNFNKVLAEGVVRKWWVTDYDRNNTDYRLYEKESK